MDVGTSEHISFLYDLLWSLIKPNSPSRLFTTLQYTVLSGNELKLSTYVFDILEV